MARKLSEMMIEYQHETKISADTSMASTPIQQQQQESIDLVRLLHDYLQSQMRVRAAAQIIDTNAETKSYKSFCFSTSNAWRHCLSTKISDSFESVLS